MNIDPSKYINPDAPKVRPYNHATDIHLIEDYMTEVRRLGFVMGSSPRMMEFVTVDYDITVARSLVFPERGEVAVFHLEVETPIGRMPMASVMLFGVDDQNVLWFSEHGGYVTASNHIAMKREMKNALTEAFGDNFIQNLMKRAREGNMPPPDEGDWWKSGGDPP